MDREARMPGLETINVPAMAMSGTGVGAKRADAMRV
jgi:hypothetical protein